MRFLLRCFKIKVQKQGIEKFTNSDPEGVCIMTKEEKFRLRTTGQKEPLNFRYTFRDILTDEEKEQDIKFILESDVEIIYIMKNMEVIHFSKF